MVDNEISTDMFGDFLDTPFMSDELERGRHIDAVHIGVTFGRSAFRWRKVAWKTHRMGGAQEAKMTFFAPTSFAI